MTPAASNPAAPVRSPREIIIALAEALARQAAAEDHAAEEQASRQPGGSHGGTL